MDEKVWQNIRVCLKTVFSRITCDHFAKYKIALVLLFRFSYLINNGNLPLPVNVQKQIIQVVEIEALKMVIYNIQPPQYHIPPSARIRIL